MIDQSKCDFSLYFRLFHTKLRRKVNLNSVGSFRGKINSFSRIDTQLFRETFHFAENQFPGKTSCFNWRRMKTLTTRSNFYRRQKDSYRMDWVCSYLSFNSYFFFHMNDLFIVPTKKNIIFHLLKIKFSSCLQKSNKKIRRWKDIRTTWFMLNVTKTKLILSSKLNIKYWIFEKIKRKICDSL